MAEAEVTSVPEYRALSFIPDAEKYPWSFQVTHVRYFFEAPVVIDAQLRTQLKAFQGLEPNQSWGWFVQTTRSVTEHDFLLLTRGTTPQTGGASGGAPPSRSAPRRPARGR